jgi:hypothetical protein
MYEKAKSEPQSTCPTCKRTVESAWLVCPSCEAVLAGPERGSRGGALYTTAQSINSVAMNPLVWGLALVGWALPSLMLIAASFLTGHLFLAPAVIGIAVLAVGVALRFGRVEGPIGMLIRGFVILLLALTGLLAMVSCTCLSIRGINISNPP